MGSKFPEHVARESAHNLERRVRAPLLSQKPEGWRSWGRAAEYNIKRLWNLTRPVPFRRDLDGWRPARRVNTERINKVAEGAVDSWKNRRTVSARRLHQMTLPQSEPGRLWRAVAHEEVSRMQKRPERNRTRSEQRSSWSYAAKRCAEQVNYEIEPDYIRDPWDLAVKWNARMRLKSEDSWWRRLKELARRLTAG